MNYETSDAADFMAVAICRLLKGRVNAFHGLASPLPAVSIALARELYDDAPEYLCITGAVNLSRHVPGVSTCGPGYWEGSSSLFSLTDIFDLCARGELDTAFLSGVQIDRFGNLNNSVIGPFHRPKVKLPGGAGSAAIVPMARQTIVWRCRHDPRIFVDRCDFVTAAGHVSWVVTPLGMLKRTDGILKLAAVAPYSSVDAVRDATSFKLPVSSDCHVAQPPSPDERAALDRIDPNGVRRSEF